MCLKNLSLINLFFKFLFIIIYFFNASEPKCRLMETFIIYDFKYKLQGKLFLNNLIILRISLFDYNFVFFVIKLLFKSFKKNKQQFSVLCITVRCQFRRTANCNLCKIQNFGGRRGTLMSQQCLIECANFQLYQPRQIGTLCGFSGRYRCASQSLSTSTTLLTLAPRNTGGQQHTAVHITELCTQYCLHELGQSMNYNTRGALCTHKSNYGVTPRLTVDLINNIF